MIGLSLLQIIKVAPRLDLHSNFIAPFLRDLAVSKASEAASIGNL